MSIKYLMRDGVKIVRNLLREGNAQYERIYANSISRKLMAGKGHPTLGKRAWRGGVGDLGRDMDAQVFARRGRAVFEALRALGLRQDMRCIDYGCGSLRVGQRVMRFLGPGCYTGIDVIDYFYKVGMSLIPPDLLAEKQPRLGVITDELIDTLAATPPDFLFSSAVLQHVPPRELQRFFGRIARLTGPQTRSVISFVSSSQVRRAGRMNWFYPAQVLVDAVRRVDSGLAVDVVPYVLRENDRRGRVREALILARSAPAVELA